MVAKPRRTACGAMNVKSATALRVKCLEFWSMVLFLMTAANVGELKDARQLYGRRKFGLPCQRKKVRIDAWCQSGVVPKMSRHVNQCVCFAPAFSMCKRRLSDLRNDNFCAIPTAPSTTARTRDMSPYAWNKHQNLAISSHSSCYLFRSVHTSFR